MTSLGLNHVEPGKELELMNMEMPQGGLKKQLSYSQPCLSSYLGALEYKFQEQSQTACKRNWRRRGRPWKTEAGIKFVHQGFVMSQPRS
jgi:hypothetical protein